MQSTWTTNILSQDRMWHKNIPANKTCSHLKLYHPGGHWQSVHQRDVVLTSLSIEQK